jgi:hypothetical protein
MAGAARRLATELVVINASVTQLMYCRPGVPAA